MCSFQTCVELGGMCSELYRCSEIECRVSLHNLKWRCIFFLFIFFLNEQNKKYILKNLKVYMITKFKKNPKAIEEEKNLKKHLKKNGEEKPRRN